MKTPPSPSSLSDIESGTLERLRRTPDAFIEECLISPYDNMPYRLTEAERAFIRHAFQLDADGKPLHQLWVYGAVKKGRKSELAQAIAITTIVLFGGKYGSAFLVANDMGQATENLIGCRRILEASPMFRTGVEYTHDKITFADTESTITALPRDASGLAGVHPTISVFDELWCAPSGDRGRAMYDQLIPVPSRKFSVRLVVSHAGFADDDHLLYQLYQRGMQLPELDKDLRGGDGMLMHWSREPLHPEWQNPQWLEMMRRELTPVKYQFMVENRFVTDASSYITGEMFDQCVGEIPSRHPGDPLLPVIAAVDAAPIRDNTAIVAIHPQEDGRARFVEARVFTPSPGHPLDFEATIEKTLIDFSKRYSLRLCVIDSRELYYLAQRLRKAGLPIEELKQTTENVTAMAQTVFDMFQTGRFSTFANKTLRDTVTRTVFEQTTGGLRFAKHQPIKIDLTVALSMALLAAQQRAAKPKYNIDVFDPNFRDLDLPPEPKPEPASGAVCGTDNWWKFKQHLNSYTTSDNRGAYNAIDNFFRYR